MKRLTVALALIVAATNLNAADSDLYYLCPIFGDASSPSGKQLNRLKNRTTMPTKSDFDSKLTLDRLVKSGNDRSRWFPSQAVEVLAYVVRVGPAAADSCNCHRNWRELRSTQIELAVTDASRDTRPIRRMVAVVTPRMRRLMKQQGVDWSQTALAKQFNHQWVRVQGWLLFDGNDVARASNTARYPGTADRATAWEIHPITTIELAHNQGPAPVSSNLRLDQLGLEIHAFEFNSR